LVLGQGQRIDPAAEERRHHGETYEMPGASHNPAPNRWLTGRYGTLTAYFAT